MKIYTVLDFNYGSEEPDPLILASNPKEAGEKFFPDFKCIEFDDDTACLEFKSDQVLLRSKDIRQHPKIDQFILNKAKKQEEEIEAQKAAIKANRLRIYEEVKKEIESHE